MTDQQKTEIEVLANAFMRQFTLPMKDRHLHFDFSDVDTSENSSDLLNRCVERIRREKGWANFLGGTRQILQEVLPIILEESKKK